jgi:urease gamma subunit
MLSVATLQAPGYQPHGACSVLGLITCVALELEQGTKLNNINAVALVRERTIPTERQPLLVEEVLTFADRGCRVVSATDSHGR